MNGSFRRGTRYKPKFISASFCRSGFSRDFSSSKTEVRGERPFFRKPKFISASLLQERLSPRSVVMMGEGPSTNTSIEDGRFGMKAPPA